MRARGLARFVKAMACAVAAALLLGNSLEICLCEADPDGCGEACHDCSAPHAPVCAPDIRTDAGPSLLAVDDCHHIQIAVDGLMPFDGSVRPVTAIAVARPSQSADLPHEVVRKALLPRATAPPSASGGGYLLYSRRLCPLS